LEGGNFGHRSKANGNFKEGQGHGSTSLGLCITMKKNLEG